MGLASAKAYDVNPWCFWPQGNQSCSGWNNRTVWLHKLLNRPAIGLDRKKAIALRPTQPGSMDCISSSMRTPSEYTPQGHHPCGAAGCVACSMVLEPVYTASVSESVQSGGTSVVFPAYSGSLCTVFQLSRDDRCDEYLDIWRIYFQSRDVDVAHQ